MGLRMVSVSLNKYYGNVRGLKNYDVEICVAMFVIVELWATIANLSLSALHAVAFATDTMDYFFRAKCDGSRSHEFAETFEEHLENACP